jgi:negative regulator of flagellin synthesis FlgM
MKITSNPSNNIAKLYQTNQSQSEKTDKKAGLDSIEQDHLHLSEQAKKIHELITETKDLPDIRAEKIARIKGEIANKTYSVSAQQLAAKMLASEKE